MDEGESSTNIYMIDGYNTITILILSPIYNNITQDLTVASVERSL